MVMELDRAIAKWWWRLEERMPAEIADGRLLLSESPVWSEYPIALYGIPDQVYVTPDGALVSVDTKTRAKRFVTVRDVVQLSVYRTIFIYTGHPQLKGRSTRPYGYLRIVSDGRTDYVRVRLYVAEIIMKLAITYLRACTRSRMTNPAA